MRKALEAGSTILRNGGTSLDGVQAAIRVMEDSGLFDAGRSPVYNHAGFAELDASIMNGKDLKAGAVAALQHIANPIDLARLVMDRTPHVLMVASGAETFAKEQGIKLVPSSYFQTDWRHQELLLEQQKAPKTRGTVGAVALDEHGNLAAGTSTGGLTDKHVGRVGDSPIIGAGTYAKNGVCAVSATGQGEFFIRYHAASSICDRIQFNHETARQAANEVIAEIAQAGGDGGVIVMDAGGNVTMPFSRSTILRATVSSDQAPVVITQDPPR